MSTFVTAPGTPRRALIVEDSVMIAMEAEDCLRELGVAEVDVAQSVDAALEYVGAHRYDLAVLDYSLGEATSEPVAQRLAEQDVPFAIATGYEGMEAQFTALGACSVLSKPYSKVDLRDLLQLIRRAEAA